MYTYQNLPLGSITQDVIAMREDFAATALEVRENASRIAIEFPFTVNVCQSRCSFLTAFAAALSRGSTTLLPSSSAPAVLTSLSDKYGQIGILDDRAVRNLAGYAGSSPRLLRQDPVAVIGHTSGSTGTPSAHPKRWSSLCSIAALNAAAIRALLPSGVGRPWIVATVPSQHMYGMELAGLLPLLAGFAIHDGHPLFPADIAAALSDVPAPRVLVTTPVHLRSLLQSGISLPPVNVIVSATAPLAKELAREVESRFATRVLEVFGSTETCIFATRRTAEDDAWQPYPGVRLEARSGGTLVSAPWLDGEVPLPDVFELLADGRFVVIGRNTDFVDVAGKRASLADLTRRICSLPGVEEAHVLQPDEPDAIGVRRVAALVVAPGMDPGSLLEALRPSIDPVFLPRPLVVLDALPRNAVGKITRSEALKALREHGAHAGQVGPG